MAFRAKLDGNAALQDVCKTLEGVCVSTVESGQMTKDLVACIYGAKLEASHYLATEDFLSVLQQRLTM